MSNQLSFYVPDEFLDPITLQVMQDPVNVIDETGKKKQAYEKKSIKKWLKKKETNPVTNEPFNGFIELESDKELKKTITAWKKKLTLKQKWELFVDSLDLSPANLNQIFNPFDTVRYEGNILPNSRSLHTDTIRKIIDTYLAIRGNAWGIDKIFKGKVEFENLPEPGLFDYATLGIFLGIQILSNYFLRAYFKIMGPIPQDASKAKKIGAISLMVLINLVSMVVLAPHIIVNGFIRPLVSAALTLAFLPFTLLAQAITKGIVKHKEKKLIKSTEVMFENGTTRTLHAAFGITSLSGVTVAINENKVAFISRNGTACIAVDLQPKQLAEVRLEVRQILIPDECRPRHRH